MARQYSADTPLPLKLCWHVNMWHRNYLIIKWVVFVMKCAADLAKRFGGIRIGVTSSAVSC